MRLSQASKVARSSGHRAAFSEVDFVDCVINSGLASTFTDRIGARALRRCAPSDHIIVFAGLHSLYHIFYSFRSLFAVVQFTADH